MQNYVDEEVKKVKDEGARQVLRIASKHIVERGVYLLAHYITELERQVEEAVSGNDA